MNNQKVTNLKDTEQTESLYFYLKYLIYVLGHSHKKRKDSYDYGFVNKMMQIFVFLPVESVFFNIKQKLSVKTIKKDNLTWLFSVLARINLGASNKLVIARIPRDIWQIFYSFLIFCCCFTQNELNMAGKTSRKL